MVRRNVFAAEQKASAELNEEREESSSESNEKSGSEGKEKNYGISFSQTPPSNDGNSVAPPTRKNPKKKVVKHVRKKDKVKIATKR